MRLRRRRHDFRMPKGPSRHLDGAFFEPTPLSATDALPRDLPEDLYEIWCEVPEAHKWIHYLAHYADAIAPFRGAPIRMLEIGVYRGGSIELWRRYLHSDSVVVGVDIDPACRMYDSIRTSSHAV